MIDAYNQISNSYENLEVIGWRMKDPKDSREFHELAQEMDETYEKFKSNCHILYVIRQFEKSLDGK